VKDFGHSRSSSGAKRKLGIACCLVIIFIIGEVIGGIMSGSLAIMSDAAHMFSGEYFFNDNIKISLISDLPLFYL